MNKPFPLRGSIYLVNFDPTVGHEIKKTRPALIIQNNLGNEFSKVTIVAAITSTISEVPHPVQIVITPSYQNGLGNRSAILLNPIRTIDQQRLIKKLGTIDDDTMKQVAKALEISLGIRFA